jgi:hypothetical protein
VLSDHDTIQYQTVVGLTIDESELATAWSRFAATVKCLCKISLINSHFMKRRLINCNPTESAHRLAQWYSTFYLFAYPQI